MVMALIDELVKIYRLQSISKQINYIGTEIYKICSTWVEMCYGYHLSSGDEFALLLIDIFDESWNVSKDVFQTLVENIRSPTYLPNLLTYLP